MRTGTRTNAHPVAVTLFLGVTLALFNAPAVGQEVAGSPVGGRGGTSFDLDCGPEGVLVGISGRVGDQINQLVAHCRQVQNDGRWGGTPFTRGAPGTTSGTPFNLRCDEHRAIVDIRGTHGPYVHQLRVNCRRLRITRTGVEGANGEVEGPIGTGGKSSFGWLTCPRFIPGRGLRGNAGKFINQLQMTCGIPRIIIVTSPDLLSPGDGVEAESLRPTFTWSGVNAATEYRLCVTREDQPENSCGVLDRKTTSTSLTPSTELPFENRDVFWNVQACNQGVCGPWSRGRGLRGPARITFAELVATFRHPRCENCHAVTAGGFTAGVGLSPDHPEVSSATDCTSCHTSALLPPGAIDPGWSAPPSTMDFRNRSDSQLCQMARGGVSGHSALEHLTQDRLILWAVDVARVPNGVLATAPPNDIEAWRSLIELWVNGGMQC